MEIRMKPLALIHYNKIHSFIKAVKNFLKADTVSGKDRWYQANFGTMVQHNLIIKTSTMLKQNSEGSKEFFIRLSGSIP